MGRGSSAIQNNGAISFSIEVTYRMNGLRVSTDMPNSAVTGLYTRQLDEESSTSIQTRKQDCAQTPRNRCNVQGNLPRRPFDRPRPLGSPGTVSWSKS